METLIKSLKKFLSNPEHLDKFIVDNLIHQHYAKEQIFTLVNYPGKIGD